MTESNKEYKAPEFRLVNTDESNKVFFDGSGTPGSIIRSAGAALSNIMGW